MPRATFRCDVCGSQLSVDLVSYARGSNGREIFRPHPHHHRVSMRLVQLDYQPPGGEA